MLTESKNSPTRELTSRRRDLSTLSPLELNTENVDPLDPKAPLETRDLMVIRDKPETKDLRVKLVTKVMPVPTEKEVSKAPADPKVTEDSMELKEKMDKMVKTVLKDKKDLKDLAELKELPEKPVPKVPKETREPEVPEDPAVMLVTMVLKDLMAKMAQLVKPVSKDLRDHPVSTPLSVVAKAKLALSTEILSE